MYSFNIYNIINYSIMDRNVLSALNNFADSIEELTKAIREQEETSDNSKKIFSNSGLGMGGRVKKIVKGIMEIKDDTKKILKNQATIIKNLKARNTKAKDGTSKGKKEELLEFLAMGKDKLKSGIGILVLLAGGILAIGTAFKLIGNVDFASVLALSLALPLIANSFAQISNIKGLTPKSALLSVGIMVALSTAIALSGMILDQMPVLTAWQLLTAVGISGTFLLISYGLEPMMESLSKIDLKKIFMLPIMLPAIATGITLSSMILSDITILSVPQTLTAIGISAMFLAISFGIKPMMKALRGIKLTELLMLPIMLPAIATGILASSYVLQYVQPIGDDILLSIIKIAGAIGLSTLAIAPSIILMSRMKVGIGTILKSMIALPAIATAISLVAGVFTLADSLGASFDIYPSLSWATGVAASLVGFTVGAMALGTILSSGIGAVILGVGSVGVMGVAAAIVAVSEILGEGDFTGGPSEEWARGVGLAIGAFSPVYDTLLKSQVISIFTGGDSMTGETYTQTMKDIAHAIIDVSTVFGENSGNWGNYPKKEWSEGVGLAISAFAPVYKNINSSLGGLIDSLFGRDTADKMKNAMLSIANGIIEVAKIFNQKENAAILSKTPTLDKDWASSVSDLVSGFAEAYAYIEKEGLEASDIEKHSETLQKIVASIVSSSVVMGIINTEGINKFNRIDGEKLKDNIENLMDIDFGSERRINKFVDNISRVSSSIDLLATSYNKLFLAMSNVASFASTETAAQKIEIVSTEIVKNNETQMKNVKPIVNNNTDNTSLSDVVDKLSSMEAKLNSIANNSSKISTYVDTLKMEKEPSIKFN